MSARGSALFYLVVIVTVGVGSQIGAPRPTVDLSVATLNGAVLVHDKSRASILVQSLDDTDRWQEVSIGGPAGVGVQASDGFVGVFEPHDGDDLDFLQVGPVRPGDSFVFCAGQLLEAAPVKIMTRSPSTGVRGEANYMMRISRPC